MATMLSGAAIIDAAILLVSANESCPQPQTKEHLMALDISGIKDIIVVQNKIDLISKEEALENYNQIKEFLKGTEAEDAPVIPLSAQHNVNVDFLIQTIQEKFKTPTRDKNKYPIFLVARSFDVNKPGSLIKNIVGGVLGGAMKCGVLKKGEPIEIRPGIKKEGKDIWKPVKTTIEGFMWGGKMTDEIGEGGSASILTKLDPSVVKSDSLVGNIVGLTGHMPEAKDKLKLEPKLLERVVGSKEELKVEDVKLNELLMLNVNSSVTVGTVVDVKKEFIEVSLKKPICVDKEDKVTISRMIGARWRLIGYGILKE
jgi:translation initiation factor 2 subunit 3